MRTRDEKLEAELIKTRNELAAYTAKMQKEHQETREEVVRISRQRKVDGEEWGKYMAQAKERDQLLTKKIAEMEEELRKAQIVPTETAGTNIGESLMEERLNTLPSEGGGGNGRGPARPPNFAGAPNPGDDDTDDESYYRAPNRPSNDPRRPAPRQNQAPNQTEAERISEMIARTMAQGSRRAAQSPFKFENKPTQDVRVWILACEDFFGRNAWQWEEEDERIKYALSMMEGSAVTPFAITYRKKMTGEFGFPRSDGYDLWENFKNQIQEKFSILHRAQRALRDMEKVRYEGDIEKYLLTLENLNIDAEMSRVAWRNMIEKRLPLEARRRWAQNKFDLDSEFVEPVRRCTKAEESFKEHLGLEKTRDNPREKGWGRGERNKNITLKENKPKPVWNKTRKNYTPEEKRLYAEKRNQATKGNNPGKVEHTDWNASTKILNQKLDNKEAEQVNAQDAA